MTDIVASVSSNAPDGRGPTKSTCMPATDDQREIWFASQLDAEASATYHLSEVITLKGPLNEPALAHAVQDLVNRHDALRINFADDGTTQVVAAQRKQFLEVVALDEAVSEDALKALLADRILEPFDFTRDLLFRSILFKKRVENSALLLVTHHIVTDGWSFGVLLNELALLYSESVEGVASSLRPAMQYRDYVSWLSDVESKARETSAREYWRDVFRELPAYFELPADRRRPPLKTFKAGHLRESLEAEFYTKLKNACRQNRCTLFQLMLASLVALLYRMTGQTDIVVGVPHAGQPSTHLSGLDGSESLVGHCANLLPLRFRHVDTRSFAGLLLDVKQRLLESRNHQEFTFSKIAELLDIQRDPSRAPLVSVSLNLAVPGDYRLGGLDTGRCLPPKEFTFFDLTIDLHQSDRDLCLDTKFNRDLYEQRSVRRWLSHWRRILEQVVDTPSTAVSQLELLTQEERDRILRTWNSTERSHTTDTPLHSLVETSVDREPSRTALVFEDESLTYIDLDRRANAIAHQLQDMGAVPGQLVGICLDRSPDMVATLLAVLKCGAAYVPLDPTYPSARISYVLEDAATAIVVTDEHTLKHLPPLPCRVLSLDGDAGEIETQPTTRPEPVAGPDDLAYVIYTSGSTGRPKGVQIEHRAAVNFVKAMAERPGLSSRDVLLAVTTVAFDIALLELILPLYVGARIVLASRETAHDPDALRRGLSQGGVTVMQATPATWGMLVESGWTGSPRLKVLCGGEALSPKLATDLLARCGELWNMYGPTETTVWSTCHRVEDGTDNSIGRPIANTQVYILDQSLHPQPIGVPGGLMIGGAGLARGYHRRPELTTDKFIASPFRRGQRLYQTGDLAKFRHDGTIECLGRVDLQVKIRGFRVELGEVESVLLSQPTIEQAVATAGEDAQGERQLVAYVKTTSGATFDESTLRDADKR